MSGYDSRHEGIENLLELHLRTIEVGGGFWVTFRATRVDPDEGRPHGIQYALTMHAPGGRRIFGYDNAHRPPRPGGPSGKARQSKEFDHIDCEGKESRPYEFVSAGKLLIDFWRDVERVLKEEGVS